MAKNTDLEAACCAQDVIRFLLLRSIGASRPGGKHILLLIPCLYWLRWLVVLTQTSYTNMAAGGKEMTAGRKVNAVEKLVTAVRENREPISRVYKKPSSVKVSIVCKGELNAELIYTCPPPKLPLFAHHLYRFEEPYPQPPRTYPSYKDLRLRK